MMKRTHLAAILIPLAFFAGYASSSGGGPPTLRTAEAPASPAMPGKTGSRSLPSGSATPAPRNWKSLQLRAGMSLDAMKEEMVAMVSSGVFYNEKDRWWLEHLIKQDPEGTIRHARENCGTGDYENFTRWCSFNCPEETLSLLLDLWQSTPRALEPDGRSPSFSFRGMGRVDPGQGLRMILDLPPGRRHPHFFRGLFEGVAESSPGQLFDYFERIRSSGGFKGEELHELMPALAQADPARALEWTREHYDPVPAWVTSQLIEGMAKSDLPAAMRLFEELPLDGQGRGSASFWIARKLAQDSLDTAMDWLTENSRPEDLAEAKQNALVGWAWCHREEAAERILTDPELVGGAQGSEMVSLMETLGRGDELVAMLERLTPEQAAKVRPLLAERDLIEVPPGEYEASGGYLRQLATDPAEAEKIWAASGPGFQERLIERLSQGSDHSQDPEAAVTVLMKSTTGLESPGGQMALARLSLVNPAAAKRVEAMPDGPARDKAVQIVLKNWSIDDSAAARSWSERATSTR
jgi:hypothetical protein